MDYDWFRGRQYKNIVHQYQTVIYLFERLGRGESIVKYFVQIRGYLYQTVKTSIYYDVFFRGIDTRRGVLNFLHLNSICFFALIKNDKHKKTTHLRRKSSEKHFKKRL